MIENINISHVWVFDQDEALDFYVGKLGLEVSADMVFGGEMRWLTVHAKGAEGRDILLEKVAPPSVDPEAAKQIRELISKGASGFAAGFVTDDARGLCEDLRSQGVDITEEPTQQFYGIDFAARDPFGNRIRFVQYTPQSGGGPNPGQP